MRPRFNPDRTEALRRDAAGDRMDAPDQFSAARRTVTRLGAVPIDGAVAFGFWTPELREDGFPPEQVVLELFVPPAEGLRLDATDQTVRFTRYEVPTVRDEDYTWTVVEEVPVGTRERIGAFYRLMATDGSGARVPIIDPLAASVPFGAAAPAEVYDTAALLAGRRDAAHFQSVDTLPDTDGIDRITAPANLLEIHAATATAGGTLGALTRHIREAAALLRTETTVDRMPPSLRAILDYDAVQLMPIEPTIEFEAGPGYWRETDDPAIVRLSRPNSTNWGYDVITAASPAINPVLLESGRPDEFLDLIETLHGFPGGPIRIVLDVVFGHADNQAMRVLNRHFFAGANMYGQNLNYRHPVVRAILLEMLRRKAAFGVDGLRIDGAQDFKYWVREDGRLHHDDDFLRLMNDIEITVADRRYRPWMVFEDGRPWPREDWELASTYRSVTEAMPRVVQWGPLTFAHNTPFLFTFWIGKWWRIREVFDSGAHWITGTSNHDTLRRGIQVHPDAPVNTYLGASRCEIFENGYDNPASHLLDVVLPGIPMDFLTANLHAPWSFVRNTDDRWAIKVVAEEAGFLRWGVTPERFATPWAFPRLKARGFLSLNGLERFQTALGAAVAATEYRPEAIAAILNAVRPALEGPQEWDGSVLTAVARDWMDDVHEFCNLDHYRRRVDEESDVRTRVIAAADIRAVRRRERWLAGNLAGDDAVDYRHPVHGSVRVTALRYRGDTVATADGIRPSAEVAPASRLRAVALIVLLEGAPTEIHPAEAIAAAGGDSGAPWRVVLATPGLSDRPLSVDQRPTFRNGDAVLYGIDG